MGKIIRPTMALGFALGSALGCASAAAAPPATGMNVGILRPLLASDARVLWMGDSFSVPGRVRAPERTTMNVRVRGVAPRRQGGVR